MLRISSIPPSGTPGSAQHENPVPSKFSQQHPAIDCFEGCKNRKTKRQTGLKGRGKHKKNV